MDKLSLKSGETGERKQAAPVYLGLAQKISKQ
jgi:hypothetical protein